MVTPQIPLRSQKKECGLRLRFKVPSNSVEGSPHATRFADDVSGAALVCVASSWIDSVPHIERVEIIDEL